MNKKEKLVHWKQLKKDILYDPKTGEFTRLRAFQSRFVGPVRAKPDKSGYLNISYNGKGYSYHRLAWFYVYKEWPKVIDHINGDPTDNRIDNLRAVNQSINCRNRNYHRSGKHIGITWDKCRKKWICYHYSEPDKPRKKTYIGRYSSYDEAVQAYEDYKE